jgi:hypothetical protein
VRRLGACIAILLKGSTDDLRVRRFHWWFHCECLAGKDKLVEFQRSLGLSTARIG